MAEFRRLDSIMSVDGKNFAVGLLEWGKIALSGSDLTTFLSDMEGFNNDIKPYIAAGNLVVNPIYETVTSANSQSVTITVGYTVTRSPDMPPDPRLDYWNQQMQQDARIIKYNSEERVS